VLVNLTLSLSAKLVEKARRVAQRQGTSLNALVRRHIEAIAGVTPAEGTADELIALMRSNGGHSGGRRIAREEAYEERT